MYTAYWIAREKLTTLLHRPISYSLLSIMSDPDPQSKGIIPPGSVAAHCTCSPAYPMKCSDEDACDCKLKGDKCSTNCMCQKDTSVKCQNMGQKN